MRRLLALLPGLLVACCALAAEDLSSIGDAAMKPLMESWYAALRERDPSLERGRWEHVADVEAISTVMFERAAMAPLARSLTPAETAPYAHQFAGDMMKMPLAIRVATTREGNAAYVLVNKRPGSPLPPRTKQFLEFALSAAGQEIAARTAGFTALAPEVAAQERRKLDGYLASLDPAIAPYRARSPVSGTIRSVGSDGMKSLMDRWMRDFRRVQPGVAPGWR